MKFRLITALALSGALLVSLSGAQAAGTPVMDGKKVKVLNFTGVGGLQDNDKDAANLATPDHYAECQAPKCGRLPFIYKPAKGAAGGLLFSITWSSPVSDFDLYVVEVDKKGNTAQDLGHCAGGVPLKERFYVPASGLKSGHTYAMVVNYFRSVNDTVHGKVEMGVPDPIPTTVPSKVNDLEHINCSL